MAENKYPSVNRVVDIANETSLAVNVLGPRKFTTNELVALMTDIRRMEGFLALLCSYVTEHRTAAAYPGGYKSDFIAWNLLAFDATKSITVGEFVLSGAEMVTDVNNTGITDARVGAQGKFTVSFGETVIASFTASTYTAHAFLRNFPGEIYHAMGSLLEEIASSYYKGEGPVSAITSTEIAALIRLQDKITKGMIEQANQTPIGCLNGTLIGAHAHAGAALARANAGLAIRALAPTIASWLFDATPTGVRNYSLESAS